MPDDAAADHQEGDAADAIRSAEVALAHQNSATAQVDLQVVTAVLNAHQKAAASRDALNTLQRDIESAVVARSDLDTPAGARDFQRYLIGKLRDIRAVVAGASLDDTSNSALMAAWTSLYNSARPDAEHPASTPEAAPIAQTRSPATEPELDPYLDPLPDDDVEMPPGSGTTAPVPPSTPTSAGVPSIPSFGGGELPSGAGFGLPASLPMPSEESTPAEFDDAPTESDDDRLVSDDKDEEPEHTEPASGPTTVTLPTGETLTAASPQLAAVIEAAASGTPIADAFRQEGMTIPPPGTAVSEPLDPTDLAPGDVGIYTDRHALALGESRALVNGQIQHISTVTGPSFLGWEHPPVPVKASDAADPPAPTRPAIAERTETA